MFPVCRESADGIPRMLRSPLRRDDTAVVHMCILGTASKRHAARLAHREGLSLEAAKPTLFICPACGGEGVDRVMLSDCRWCLSNGLVDLAMTAVFLRWCSMHAFNRGRCAR